MEYTGTDYIIPNDYEKYNSSKIIFCPNCGAMNRISLDWYGSIQGIIFCDKCGREIE